jgi:SAM-dependent methyltransferase
MQEWQRLDELVRSETPQLLDAIRKATAQAHNEAELRFALQSLLMDFAQKAGISLTQEHERLIGKGRADTLYNRLIVEWESPRSLRQPARRQHALNQLHALAQETARQNRLQRVGCVAFDGETFLFARYWDDEWHTEDPVPLSGWSLRRFLKMLIALETGRALIAENLFADFALGGEGTDKLPQRVTQTLYTAIRSALKEGNHLAIRLFEQWEQQFSQATGYRQKAEQLVKSDEFHRLADGMGIGLKEAETHLSQVLFCLQTYYALLVKLLAWLTVSRYLGGRLGSPLAQLKDASEAMLRDRLRHMERGALFREFGIVNFMEADFFGWYLRDGVWGGTIAENLSEMIERLLHYDPATLPEAEPGQARDLLKVLYQRMMPRKIRHDLGEYYTPDWLALRLLRQINSDLFADTPADAARRRSVEENLLRWRFLDPACGSGTFLVLLIHRLKEVATAMGTVSEADLLRAILNNVVGIDLAPVAVLTARANYLLALGELLEAPRTFEVHLPVYLADSILTPHLRNAATLEGIPLPTSVGTFKVPQEFVEAGTVNELATSLEWAVENSVRDDAFWQQVARLLPKGAQGNDVRERTLALYHQLRALHDADLNGLWARILKNAFAPLFIGKFDYIVGNPPWVNWENLPDGYRRQTAYLWERYGLAARKGASREQFELGKKKGDLSALMTLSVADTLLKPNGRLGFVITQSLLKTSAAAGFRQFQIPQPCNSPIPLRVVHVDDMVDLQPFEGASNRTAILVLEKGRPTKYPIPYTLWRKKKGAHFSPFSTLDEVTEATERLHFVAEPVNPSDPTSPWLSADRKALAAIRKVLGKSDYEAHEGVNTGGANAIYWMEVLRQLPDGKVLVRNLTEGAKRKVEEVIVSVEPDLLYPLLRGRDVRRWQAKPSVWILVPHTVETGWQAICEEQMQKEYPKTWSYLHRFRKVLLSRPAYRLLRLGHPFYILKDISTYTFAPWKVVWTRLARIEAAVIGLHEGKPIVPQETVTLVECSRENEAHYICALVNSSPFQFAAISYSQKGGKSMGSMHILEHIRLPRFNPRTSVHRRLAELSMRAHEAMASGLTERVAAIEAEIDRLAARLWGLTDEELKAIQVNLQLLETSSKSDDTSASDE